MDQDHLREKNQFVVGLKKYRLAGVGFFILNLIYIFIAWWKLPPVDPSMNKLVNGALLFFIFVNLFFTPLIFRGTRLLVQVLAVIYGGRAIYSVYSLIGGESFSAVPYFLPCLFITFYLLGRAAWDWP